MRTAFFAAAVAVLCSVPAIAAADEGAATDGVAQRRVYFRELLGVSTQGFESSIFTYQRQSRSSQSSQYDSDSFRVAPSADVRVAGVLTVGLTLGGTYQRFHDTVEGPNGSDVSWGTWAFFAVPRVGLLLPLGKRFAVWPRVGAGPFVGAVATQTAPYASSRQTQLGVVIGADASFLLGITREVFLSLGPTVSWSSSSLTPSGRESFVNVGAIGGLGLAL